MSLFLDPRTKKRKSPIALFSFLTAVLFLLVYGILFSVLTDPLYRYVSLGNPLLTTAAHALIVSLSGTLVCCLAFLLPDKRIAPLGFLGLAVFFGLSCLAAAFLGAGARAVMLELIALYGLGPAAVGNAVGWTIYRRLRKTRGADSSASSPGEPRSVGPELTEKAALFGPEAGGAAPEEGSLPPDLRSPQEEAALFYSGR